MNSKIYENFLEANEIARKIYYLKFKKYIGIIYLIVGALVPITLAVPVILRTPLPSYVSAGIFILGLIPVIFLNTKILELYKIINKLNKIIYKRDIYSIIYNIIMKILIGLIIVCGFLYRIGIGGDLILFWIIELWLSYTFFRFKFKISLEDWLAILSPVGLILQNICPYSVLIFASIWIFSGVVSMVRAYGKP
ncbi:MAG: hypothetical protein RRE78_07040 [Acidianus sp.]|jgi:hypothetical protein|nr:hypothetical protein [Acidianus sp.]